MQSGELHVQFLTTFLATGAGTSSRCSMLRRGAVPAEEQARAQ